MFKNFFGNLKGKAVRAMLKKQLAQLPKDQQEMIMKVVEANPEFFQKIAKEIEAKKKEGMNEQYASMQVMQKYRDQMQQLMLRSIKK